MGLDMYVYKVLKPSLEPDKVYDQSELSGYSILPPDEDTSDLVEQLIPYTQKLRVINDYYDMKKICEDFRMPDANICMISGTEISISGKIDGMMTTQSISNEQIDTLYTERREEECFVFTEETVAYWRKCYDLQELISDCLGGYIHNTGFYLLDENTVETINRYCDGNSPEESIEWHSPTETSALFYHEWY